MKIMAIDYGDAHTGIAISDATGTLAGFSTVINSRRPEVVAQEIAALIPQHGVGELVLGYPKNMDGTLGPRAEKAAAFGETLKELTGLPLTLWDERRTTIDAHNILFNNGQNAKKRKKTVDAVAAALMLEGSETYVASKVKTCNEIGFKSSLIRYEADVTEEELLRKVDELNNDPDVDGFIVQLPLPKHISEQKIIEAIDYRKDVDGFHPINVGRMSIGLPCFVSATPAGILELLRRYEIPTRGKHCVVLGRSNIVGKPMATLMMQKAYPGDCTVTVCHSRSENLKEMCLSADIIIVALGVPEFLKGDMVKEGAVIVDVGTTRVPDATRKSGFKLTGDVKFDEVAPKCSYITPVPGGVGPMTIISLMRNTLLAGKKEIYK